MREPLPGGPAQGMLIESDTLEMMKEAYYEIRGWDIATGKPTIVKLEELELNDLIEDLWVK
jgi:aldehyde:ferredoxin oxidoreductase